jgi:hypothetical protein
MYHNKHHLRSWYGEVASSIKSLLGRAVRVAWARLRQPLNRQQPLPAIVIKDALIGSCSHSQELIGGPVLPRKMMRRLIVDSCIHFRLSKTGRRTKAALLRNGNSGLYF